MKPEDLDINITANHPKPTGWRLLIAPAKFQEKTQGGILLPDETREIMEHAATVCFVVDVGPDAYQDGDKFPTGPWCQKGDWIMIGRYAGSRFIVDGQEYRIINDDNVICKVNDPSIINKFGF